MTTQTSATTTAEVDLRYHLHPMTRTSNRSTEDVTVIDSAKGSYVTIGGREYLDALSGLGCVNIGYGNEAVCKAGAEAMLRLSYAHSFAGLTNTDAASLARKLVELTGGVFDRFFFASTGSDANESAIKIAYYYWLLRGQPEKRLLLARKHAYHGNTIVATSLTGLDLYHPQFGLPLPGLVHHADAPYYYKYGNGGDPEEFGLDAARSIERTILEVGADKIAAMIAEPIQGTAGIIIPPSSYWSEVRRICDKYDILLIADEVITGFGKTGEMFGFQRFGFEPDMITMAKGLTSGYFPVSAVGVSSKILSVLDESPDDFEHGFTYCAHPVGAAVALANIAVLEDGLVERVSREIEPAIAEGLKGIDRFSIVGDVRAMGVMAAVEFKAPSGRQEDVDALCHSVNLAMFERGVIARELWGSIAFIFPLIVTVEDLKKTFAALHEVIAEVDARPVPHGEGHSEGL